MDVEHPTDTISEEYAFREVGGASACLSVRLCPLRYAFSEIRKARKADADEQEQNEQRAKEVIEKRLAQVKLERRDDAARHSAKGARKTGALSEKTPNLREKVPRAQESRRTESHEKNSGSERNAVRSNKPSHMTSVALLPIRFAKHLSHDSLSRRLLLCFLEFKPTLCQSTRSPWKKGFPYSVRG
jgi:hypothetical protein